MRACATALLAMLAACGRLGFEDAAVDRDVDGGVDGDGAPLPDGPPNTPDGPPIPPAAAVVYVHSPTDLFEVDPDTFGLRRVGGFGGAFAGDTMTDIALDRSGQLIGISFTQLYRIDPTTAACTLIAPLPRQFNGLTFMESPSDPNADILIGTTLVGEMWEIDLSSGANTRIGRYGGGIASAGDVVYVRGFGAIAAARPQSDNTDWIASVDLQTGAATMIGDTGLTDIFGIAYWNGSLYGFTDSGTFVLIDPDTGAATVKSTGAIRWWGAGVTTAAVVAKR